MTPHTSWTRFPSSRNRRRASTASTGRSVTVLETYDALAAAAANGHTVRFAARASEEGDMSRFQLREIRVENYRCFDELRLPLEEDTTVLFAENGGGKTALLTALAMGLAVIPEGFAEDPEAQRRGVILRRGCAQRAGGPPEPAGSVRDYMDCRGRRDAEIRHVVHSGSARVQDSSVRYQAPAPTDISRPWSRCGCPECGGRCSRGMASIAWNASMTTVARSSVTRDRWEAYASALDPNLDEAPLLQWLQDEFLGDTARSQQKLPERSFHRRRYGGSSSGDARRHARLVRRGGRKTPSCASRMDTRRRGSELSDGYHVFIALVADIARRAVMLNEFDGADAPARVEGVVLIDELDLHLHPRWQRVALPRLREAFPRLQFIISTHSPQVLSSAENRHARWLVNGRIEEPNVFVSWRDSNAILRDLMETDDRDDKGAAELRRLYKAIDQENHKLADRIHQELAERWGVNDPALIRARGFMEE